MYDTGSLQVHSNSRHCSVLPGYTARLPFCSICGALLLLLLLFLLHVWHTRECIYHHFSLSQQHCIWKRIKEKGKADGTGMYMWTARHEEHRFQLRKLAFFKWVHMYILTDGDSQQSNLPRRILAGDENPAVQRTMLMSYQRLDSAQDLSRLAQQECKKNARDLHGRRLWPKVQMRVRKCSLVPFPAFHSGSIYNGYPFITVFSKNFSSRRMKP